MGELEVLVRTRKRLGHTEGGTGYRRKKRDEGGLETRVTSAGKKRKRRKITWVKASLGRKGGGVGMRALYTSPGVIPFPRGQYVLHGRF